MHRPIATRAAALLAIITVALVGLAGTAGAQGTPTVGIGGNDELGGFLVGANGNTVYVFTNDSGGESTCFDQCAAAWPPLTVGAGVTPTKAAGVEGTLGIFERPDGSRQVTLDGQPLYYWAADSGPGQATGQGVNGVWFVVEAQQASGGTGGSEPGTGGSNPDAPSTGTGLQTAEEGMLPLWLLLVAAGAASLFAGSTVLAFTRR
jgi:predicted lipoprotein with Yx(FWY)xxD motif